MPTAFALLIKDYAERIHGEKVMVLWYFWQNFQNRQRKVRASIFKQKSTAFPVYPGRPLIFYGPVTG